MNNVIAVDPGVTGSFAHLQITDGKIKLLKVESIGIRNSKGTLMPNLTWKHDLYWLCSVYDAVTVIEDVHSFPGQGVATTFTFGVNLGCCITAIELAECTPIFTDPKQWQRRLGLPHHCAIVTRDKRRRAHRKSQQELALKLFPQLKSEPGDVYASVLIGYAAAMDLLGIPLGRLS